MLMAADHGASERDPVGAAVGRSRVSCIDVLNAWAALKRDPRLLTALARAPEDKMAPAVEDGQEDWSGLRSFLQWQSSDSGGTQSRPSGAVARHPIGHPSSMPAHVTAARAAPLQWVDHLSVLASLGGDIPLRLVATVTAELLKDLGSNQPGADRAVPALEVSLIARATRALSSWSATGKHIEVVVAAEGTKATVQRSENASLRAALPLRWVADVWGRRLAVVGDRFSLAVVESSSGRVVLETIGADFGPPGFCVSN